MQEYAPLLPTGIISEDRATINNNIESVASNFSGNSFPTTNLYDGMRCWRTDRLQMYQYKSDNAEDRKWVLVEDLSNGYNSVAHAIKADQATKDANGNDISSTYTKVENESSVILRCYPVGSIYMSVNSTSPTTLFGGTWQAISQGRVLIGAGNGYNGGATGGSATHTIGTGNLPNHTHTASVTVNSGGGHTHTGTTSTNGAHTHSSQMCSGDSGTGYSTDGDDPNGKYTNTGSAGNHNHTFTTNSGGSHSHTASASVTGGGSASPTAISNLQPYLVVYMWQRVS